MGKCFVHKVFAFMMLTSLFCSCDENFEPTDGKIMLYSVVDNTGVVFAVENGMAQVVHIDNFYGSWIPSRTIDGEDWHITTEEELLKINDRKERLNKVINSAGGDKISEEIYWINKTAGSSEAERYHLGHGCKWYSAFTSSSNNTRYVREVPVVDATTGE